MTTVTSKTAAESQFWCLSLPYGPERGSPGPSCPSPGSGTTGAVWGAAAAAARPCPLEPAPPRPGGSAGAPRAALKEKGTNLGLGTKGQSSAFAHTLSSWSGIDPHGLKGSLLVSQSKQEFGLISSSGKKKYKFKVD